MISPMKYVVCVPDCCADEHLDVIGGRDGAVRDPLRLPAELVVRSSTGPAVTAGGANVHGGS